MPMRTYQILVFIMCFKKLVSLYQISFALRHPPSPPVVLVLNPLLEC
jgi:hypothetical protein